jgi:hypothetical protein
MSIVMGLDQHRAQIMAEWLDTVTGDVSRGRIVPADRRGVRRFLARFEGSELEVALEATTSWRFVVEELRSIAAKRRQHCKASSSSRAQLENDPARPSADSKQPRKPATRVSSTFAPMTTLRRAVLRRLAYGPRLLGHYRNRRQIGSTPTHAFRSARERMRKRDP